MKQVNFIYAILVLSLFSISAFAQNKMINGVVYGIDGILEGAKISVVGEKISTITDANGKYKLDWSNNKTYISCAYKKMEKTIQIDENLQKVDFVLVPSEKDLFKEVNERKEIRLCDIYVDNYPDGKNIDEVNKLKEQYLFIEAYNIAASQFSDTALRNYLKLYPNGAFKQKAFDAIEIAAWQKARYENTVDAYQEYLNNYPTGKAASMAKEKMAVIE